MKSNGGGRKRGRPVTLTPEQRLGREKERWRRRKARQRKEAQDAKWERQTNFGYFVRLWVPHYNRLTEALVGRGYLDEKDKDIAPRVDAGADEVFAAIGYHWLLDIGRARPFGTGVPGTVRVRMTQELANKLAEGEYSKRFSPHDLRWADERVEYLRESYLEERALAAREQRKPLFLRVPPFGCRDYAERLAKCLNHIRGAEAKRDEIRRSFRTLEEFKEEFFQNKNALTGAAERYLNLFCDNYIPKQPHVPCNCKLALPECDCILRFRPEPGPGILARPPKPKRPRAGKVLAKRSLYSGRMPRWWRHQRHDDDPIIHSHAELVEEPPRDKRGKDEN